jgi:iron complex outermembrane receptor protein
MLAYFDDNDNINRYLSNLTLTWQIMKDLSYKIVFGYDKSKSERISFADPRLSSAYGGNNNIFGVDLQNPITGNGRAFKKNIDVKSILIEHYLTYNKTFSGGSVINAVAGYSYQSFESEYAGVIGWGLTTPVVEPDDVFVKDFGNFTDYYNDIPSFSKSQLQSFFGRVNYSLHEKYFLTGTVRADGSSKFGENNRYGVFPAFAVKWGMLREGFAQSLTNTFSDLSNQG